MGETAGPAWSWRTEALPGVSGWRGRLALGERFASMHEVLLAWRDDAGLRACWAGWLRGMPLDAWVWETPPLTLATLARPFECVFIESPPLARAQPDPFTFAAHFERQPEAPVVVFESLGRDALLIAPNARATATPAAGTHLAAFVRGAPAALVDEAWATVGRCVLGRLGASPLWLSTSGLGVYWLHFRLDTRPKYYQHRPYRAAT